MDFIRDPSLVLYLPLYLLDGSNFADRSAYGHLCTNHGSIWTPRGRDFDGLDDWVSLPTAIYGDNFANKKASITLELCLNPIDTGARQIVAAIGFWGIWLDCRIIVDHWSFALTDVTRMSAFAEDPSPLTYGVCQHIVGTYDQSNIRLFLNSNLRETTAWADKTLRNDGNTSSIGAVSSGSLCTKGLIGEVRIYSRALNPLEIQRNYLSSRWRYQ